MAQALLPLRSLVSPSQVFSDVAEHTPRPIQVFFTSAIWLALLPPLFSYVGTGNYGWRLGTVEAVMLTDTTRLYVSIAYFAVLLMGFFSAAIISRWMAVTYDATDELGAHFSLLTIVAAPLSIASAVQLYPDVFLGVLVLVPAIIWSLYLLYRGLPVVLRTTPEQGMLMASAIVGYLLVAAVSLLGLTVFLWVLGVGPALGV